MRGGSDRSGHPGRVLVGVLTLASAAAAAPPERAFDWTLGSWQGVRRAAGVGDGDPVRMDVVPILDGAGQQRELSIDTGSDGPYLGYAVQLYEPGFGWVRQYANGVRARFVRMEGTLRADGASVWEVIAPARARRSRLVSERTADGRWLRTMSVSEDDGESWRVLWSDELRRTDTGSAEIGATSR